MSSPFDLADALKTRARELGFGLVGIAPAARPETLDQFRDWLRQGLQGEMHYLPRREAAYEHPESVLTGVRSIVLVAMNYGPGASERPGRSRSGANHKPDEEQSDRDADRPLGQIAAYAQGSRDYHDVLRERLQQLAAVIHDARPGSRTRIVVDTAPLLERDLARRAGLGWFGKNTMLINKHVGSYFFLAGLLTDCELPADAPHSASHCGTCTRCLEACPTAAFPAPYVLDASRCIAYLTIELRDQAIPEPLRAGMGDWLFGCDVCQQVCPWNRKAPPAAIPELGPVTAAVNASLCPAGGVVCTQDPFEGEVPSDGNPSVGERGGHQTAIAPNFRIPDARQFLTLSPAEFQARFGETPLARPGREGMARNAAIVIGNAGNAADVPALAAALDDESPLVRGAAAWGLGSLGGAEGASALRARLLVESDRSVLAELHAALEQIADS